MELSKQAKSKLSILIRYMEALPKSADKHFDMADWAVHKSGAFKRHHKIKNGFLSRTVTRGCGTSACALGWACSVPSFYKAGLRLKVSEWDGKTAAPSYKGHNADNAAMKFFGLSSAQTYLLFHSYSIKTPKRWAENARRLVKEWSAKAA